MKIEDVKKAFLVIQKKPANEAPAKGSFGQSLKLYHEWEDGQQPTQAQVDQLPDKDKEMLAKYL